MIGIKTEYMPFSDVYRQLQPWKDRVLGAVAFIGYPTDNIFVKNIPTIQLHAPILEGTNTACETWLSNTISPLISDKKGEIQYRLNDELLFGVISLTEFDPSQSKSEQNDKNTSSLQDATESAYRQIFALIDDLDYPYLYRFWNYMANINDISHGLERYRQFNVGRKNVFMNSREIGKHLPAACALGLADGPLTIAFLAGRKSPVAIENPRQISAYEYPEQYGPCTPSFSRATLLRTEQDALLFISGTASIVGHQTQHSLDIVAQTKETLANLDAVVAEANRILGELKFNLQNTFFRVYIRHAADLSLVRTEIQRHMGGTIKAVFIQADICRSDLLLEIEATVQCVAELTCTE